LGRSTSPRASSGELRRSALCRTSPSVRSFELYPSVQYYALEKQLLTVEFFVNLQVAHLQRCRILSFEVHVCSATYLALGVLPIFLHLVSD
jgi:hypothetical protein